MYSICSKIAFELTVISDYERNKFCICNWKVRLQELTAKTQVQLLSQIAYLCINKFWKAWQYRSLVGLVSEYWSGSTSNMHLVLRIFLPDRGSWCHFSCRGEGICPSKSFCEVYNSPRKIVFERSFWIQKDRGLVIRVRRTHWLHLHISFWFEGSKPAAGWFRLIVYWF